MAREKMVFELVVPVNIFISPLSAISEVDFRRKRTAALIFVRLAASVVNLLSIMLLFSAMST